MQWSLSNKSNLLVGNLRRFILFAASTLSCLVILHVLRSFGTLPDGTLSSTSKHEGGEAALNKNESRTTTIVNDITRQQRLYLQWKKQAQYGLNKTMAQQKVFDSWGFTNTTSVLQRGFPLSWDSCTVKGILLNSNKASLPRITVVLMGGSLAARAATDCKAPGDKDASAGRYSNLWQYFSDQDTLIKSTKKSDDDGNTSTPYQPSSSSLPLKIINRGQGATRTGWSTMHLDDLVDPLETDILVWDYSLNDNFGRSWELGVKGHDLFEPGAWMLDAWFARVKYLYENVGKMPPPIILVFFWENGVANNATRILSGGLGTPYNGAPKELMVDNNTLPSAAKIVQKYRQELGWNIQVVDVGGALDPHREYIAQESHWRLVWDDGVHPACPANTLAARMLQYVLYQDIATCSHHPNDSESHTVVGNRPHLSLPRPVLPQRSFDNQNQIATNDDSLKLLFEQLQDPNTKIASHTLMVPTLTSTADAGGNGMKQSNLLVTPQIVSSTGQPLNTTGTSVSTHKMGWADPRRQDRKYSYDLPYCDGPGKQVLMLQLEYKSSGNSSAPDFEWIGLGMVHWPTTLIRLTLNHDIEIPIRSLLRDHTEVSRYWFQIPYWIRLSDYLSATTDDKNSPTGLTLQVCQTREEPPVDLYEIVAVMK